MVRPLFITAGVLLAGVLLLLMTSLNLLVLFGYIPYAVRGFFAGASFSHDYLKEWTQWATVHQLLCLLGGFLWLAATVSYARLSGDACLYCGRRDGPEGWNSPDRCCTLGSDRRVCVRWQCHHVFYAFTRYAWALGVPAGDERGVPAISVKRVGTWVSDSSWRPSAWWEPSSPSDWCSVGVRFSRAGYPAWLDAGPHRFGGCPGLARIGAAGGGWHRDLVRLGPDGR